MKFIDEIDIELVNQELNFQTSDENLVIKGGCDLFTTKAIGSDRKLFKTIDRHLDQIMEDYHLSQSIENERKNSITSSTVGSSTSFTQMQFSRRDSISRSPLERDRKADTSLLTFQKSDVSEPETPRPASSNLSLSLSHDSSRVDESPFGPLKSASTRKTFAYLIAILNATYPDHDFSNLQPSTDNFHKLDTSESLIHKFNSIMISLGKREDILSWIWDTINVYMELIPPRSPSLTAQPGTDSRKYSFTSTAGSPKILENHFDEQCCKIYEFQPTDQSILEDLDHPHQTMWSNYWFIHNKKKKRVCFLFLKAIKKEHTRRHKEDGETDDNEAQGLRLQNSEFIYHEDTIEDNNSDMILTDNDVLGDIEI